MSTLTLVLVAVGLALDAVAVAIGTSVALRTVSGRQVFRLGFHFGLFQALMPLLGWSAGRSVSQFIAGWDHWVAFALLSFVGVKAIHAALFGGPERAVRADPTRGLNLVLLSLATSLDALAVGLSLAVLHVEIWYAAAIIGLTTAALTTAAMLLGARLGTLVGRRLEVLGGVILIAIGAKILVQDLA